MRPTNRDFSSKSRAGSRILTGLPAVIQPDSRVLVLGSFPSVKALEKGEYYGNPQNLFWRLLAESLEPGRLPASWKDKLAFLSRHRLALWNVIGACERTGSSDSRIRHPVYNDVPGLLIKCSGIRKVLLNGRYPEKIWKEHFASKTNVPAFYVPASSSRHAAVSPAKKLDAWRRHLAAD